MGVTFATTAQITKGLRGKVDEVNSFVGGAAVGALTASQVTATLHYILEKPWCVSSIVCGAVLRL